MEESDILGWKISGVLVILVIAAAIFWGLRGVFFVFGPVLIAIGIGMICLAIKGPII